MNAGEIKQLGNGECSLTMRTDEMMELLQVAHAAQAFKWFSPLEKSHRGEAIGYDRETETILVDPDRLMQFIMALNPAQESRPLRFAKLKRGQEVKPEEAPKGKPSSRDFKAFVSAILGRPLVLWEEVLLDVIHDNHQNIHPEDLMNDATKALRAMSDKTLAMAQALSAFPPLTAAFKAAVESVNRAEEMAAEKAARDGASTEAARRERVEEVNIHSGAIREWKALVPDLLSKEEAEGMLDGLGNVLECFIPKCRRALLEMAQQAPGKRCTLAVHRTGSYQNLRNFLLSPLTVEWLRASFILNNIHVGVDAASGALLISNAPIPPEVLK